jgi:transposase
VRVLALVDELDNVSEACRLVGVSRTSFYEWRRSADAYGLEALMPKDRRRPQQPQATPTHVIEELLTMAVLEPTIGCRQYADRLAERGYVVSKSTVQKLLVEHGPPGRKAEPNAKGLRSRH